MFDFAQTFLLDPSAVKKAAEVGITKVELYFRGKPQPVNNKSGIAYPGVTVMIAPTLYGIPLVNELGVIRPQEPTEHGARFNIRNELARVEWEQIQVSTDASAATTFKFREPVWVKTGQEYAIVVSYDGHEDFLVWFSRAGDPLIGTGTTASGPAGTYVGKYFGYISPEYTDHDPSSGYNYSNTSIADTVDNPAFADFASTPPESITLPTQDYLLTNWRPDNDVDLKFTVYCARFFHNGFPVFANSTYTDDPASGIKRPLIDPIIVSNNQMRLVSPCNPMEYLIYDRTLSKEENVLYGDTCFQNTFSHPGGTATPLTINVSNNSVIVNANASYLLANGNTFNGSNGFNRVFPNPSNSEFIIIRSGTDVCVRRVMSVLSNSQITLSDPPTFTNAVATFSKAPIGRLVTKSKAYTFGKNEDIIHLVFTTANSSMRFVNNCIESITVNAAGNGYSNSDYLTISGYESVNNEVLGGYSATANIVTNANGNITAVYMSNLGCGFVNTAWLTGANVTVSNSTGGNVIAAVANGATFNFNVGMTVSTVQGGTNTYFGNCKVVNIEASWVKPEITINHPIGGVYNITHRTKYLGEKSSNTYSGMRYYIDPVPGSTDKIVKIFKEHIFESYIPAVITSRSNEFIIPYSNGSLANSSDWGQVFSNTSVYFFDITSNNDFHVPFIEPQMINSHFAKYIINNDYTDEHTNYGNAYAKHVVTKVNFIEDRFAEDLVVYMTCYRPVGTDFAVYGRIHHSDDVEAFDDKDWTLLEQVDGIGTYSSSADPSNYIELTYNFRPYPNSAFTLTGRVETSNNSANVVGTGTTFSSNLAANDMVRIYSPLFPNNYLIDVVSSVTNATHLVLQQPITNNNVLGTGFKIDKVAFPKQAFNNQLNSNVVRYYNEELAQFDGYDTFQIKVVMLSNNTTIVPKIDDIRAIGVTS